MIYHNSVFLEESVGSLLVKDGGKYIDCTLGDGGHLLKILSKGGIVLGIDLDTEALRRSRERFKKYTEFEGRYKLVLGNFRDVVELGRKSGFSEVDGILYDLGTSYNQLESLERGFSFTSDSPLDMRMGREVEVTAKDLVNGLSERELSNLISAYGEDKFGRRIAKAIVRARKEKEIGTCLELSELISSCVPRVRGVSIHPATKTFQALRIAVNDELSNLDVSLNRVSAEPLLIPGGRVVIITFHSLEDKIAKRARPTLKPVGKKPIPPTMEEVAANVRARSAKMRVFEKI